MFMISFCAFADFSVNCKIILNFLVLFAYIQLRASIFLKIKEDILIKT